MRMASLQTCQCKTKFRMQFTAFNQSRQLEETYNITNILAFIPRKTLSAFKKFCSARFLWSEVDNLKCTLQLSNEYRRCEWISTRSWLISLTFHTLNKTTRWMPWTILAFLFGNLMANGQYMLSIFVEKTMKGTWTIMRACLKSALKTFVLIGKKELQWFERKG